MSNNAITVYQGDFGEQRIIIGGVDYDAAEAIRRLIAYDDYAAILGLLFDAGRLPLSDEMPVKVYAAVRALLQEVK